jgi:hypothetical protein
MAAPMASLLKAGLGADGGHHATHAGRELRALDVQLPVARALALLAMRTDKVAPLELDQPQHGQQLARTGVVIVRPMSTATERGARLGRGFRQQTAEDGGAGTGHRSAHQCFDGFQIDSFGLADTAADDLQQAAYFLGDFVLDRFGRLFSCGVRVSCTGRRRQICSLTSNRS